MSQIWKIAEGSPTQPSTSIRQSETYLAVTIDEHGPEAPAVSLLKPER